MPPVSQPTLPPATPKKPAKTGLIIVAALVAIAAIAVGVWYFMFAPRADDTADTNRVTITSNGFTPSTIRVKQGDQVTWANDDNKQRGIIADQQDITDLTTTEPLRTGDTFTYTFEKPGTYTYRDSAFPDTVQGVVIVE